MAVGVIGVLWVACAIAGFAGLAIEMTWLRSATLVFGQTVATTTAVLAAYFAGLGAGAAAGRGIRRYPVRACRRASWGAALGIVWSFALFSLFRRDAVQAWLAPLGAFSTLLAVAIAVMPATACFGVLLPAFGQHLATRADVGRPGAWLYAVNTLGGAVGCALTGFGLPLFVGVGATYALSAALCAAAGLLALFASDRPAIPEAVIVSAATSKTPRSNCGRLRLVAAASGAIGLGLEVVWIHLFAQVLHNSVYSFTAVALVFLLALAGGATLAAVLLHRVAPAALATGALLSAALLTVADLWSFMHWTGQLAYFGMHDGLLEYIARIVALAAVTAGPAAFAAGAVLPALWALWRMGAEPARPLGDLGAANALGGVAGLLAAGWLAPPLLGLRGMLLAAALGYVALAETVRLPTMHWRPIIATVLLAVLLANPLRAPLVHLVSKHETLRALDEGASGIVSVVASDDDLQLRLDNYYVLGGTAAATGERRLGLLPLLLHPAPRRALFIGLATGITASATLAAGVPNTTVVEVAPEIAAAARTFFAPWNAHLLEQPGVHLVIDDGRHYLATHDAPFDVVVTDLFVPWHQGSGALYSREMYEVAARRLAAGGLFCQWLPLYQLTREEFDMIARTFLAVFPDTTLWRADFYPNRPVVALIGRLRPATVDAGAVHERMTGLPPWSRDPLLDSPRALAMLYAGDLRADADLFAAAPLNTDDRPRLEFTAPRLTRINAAGDKDWFTGEALAEFYDQLASRGPPHVFTPPSPGLDDAQRAGTALLRYAIATTQHDDADAARFEADVRALVPDVVADAESPDAGSAVADARRVLLDLQIKRERVRRRLEAAERHLQTLAPADPVGQ